MARIKRLAATRGGRGKGPAYPKPINNTRMRMPAKVEKTVRARQQQARKACAAEEALLQASALTPEDCARRDQARAQIARKLGILAELTELKGVLRSRQQRYKKQLARSGKRLFKEGR